MASQSTSRPMYECYRAFYCQGAGFWCFVFNFGLLGTSLSALLWILTNEMGFEVEWSGATMAVASGWFDRHSKRTLCTPAGIGTCATAPMLNSFAPTFKVSLHEITLMLCNSLQDAMMDIFVNKNGAVSHTVTPNCC